MMRHAPWFLVFFAALGLAACGEGGEPAPSAPSAFRPAAPVNVVLILIDTLRADAILDPAGQYSTPNIDLLAADGVMFPRAYSSAPMTLPSHVSLFSSRPPLETKVLNNDQLVPKTLPLAAEWFRQNRYDTRAVLSLATMNPPVVNTGVARGFASYDVDYWLMSRAEDTAQRLWRSLDQRDASAPLFLFAHFSDPHEPYNSHGAETKSVALKANDVQIGTIVASDWNQHTTTVELPTGRSLLEFKSMDTPGRRFRVRVVECREQGEQLPLVWEQGKELERLTYARVAIERGERPPAACELRLWLNDVPERDLFDDRYRSEVAYVDRYVGELVQRLKELGLYDDSLVVFTSDHGESLGEHNFFGHVEYLTDEMIHVPLIVKLPRQDPRRPELERSAASMVSHLDLVPTLLDVAGLAPLEGQRGTSLLVPHTSVHIAETHRPEAKKNQIALRDGEYKMIYFADEERFELYALATDPQESQDVYATQSGRRPHWPEKLVALYEESTRAGSETEGQGVVDPALLKALGYGGDEHE